MDENYLPVFLNGSSMIWSPRSRRHFLIFRDNVFWTRIRKASVGPASCAHVAGGWSTEISAPIRDEENQCPVRPIGRLTAYKMVNSETSGRANQDLGAWAARGGRGDMSLNDKHKASCSWRQHGQQDQSDRQAARQAGSQPTQWYQLGPL